MLSTLVQSGTISLTIGWIDMKLCTNIHVPLKLTLTFGFYSLIELLSTNVDSRFNCVLDGSSLFSAASVYLKQFSS